MCIWTLFQQGEGRVLTFFYKVRYEPKFSTWPPLGVAGYG